MRADYWSICRNEGGRVGFRIKRVALVRTADLEEDDARFGLAEAVRELSDPFKLRISQLIPGQL